MMGVLSCCKGEIVSTTSTISSLSLDFSISALLSMSSNSSSLNFLKHFLQNAYPLVVAPQATHLSKPSAGNARYSSDSQTEQSIEGQLRVCEDYAKSHDILILNTYIDRAMTGTNDNRPDFQRMIKDSNTKKWDYVLCYKLDRFSRNKYEMAMHKKTLKDNGIRVI